MVHQERGMAGGPTINSPFHARTSALTTTPWWYGWNGYLIPDVYTGMEAELAAVRGAAGVIDMSPLPKLAVRGPDAARLIDKLITRDVSQLAVRQIYYSPLCDENGRLVNDGLVFRLDEDSFVLSMDNCVQWLTRHGQGFDVEIQDITTAYALLSLQGPRSREVLEAATHRSWSDLPFSRLETTAIGGVEVSLARQGYTGELGYELWVRAGDAVAMFDAVMAAGEPLGLRPVGEHAVEVARVEAGLIMISADYTSTGPDQRCAEVAVDAAHTASPFEMGLGRLVDFGKAHFIGREALLAEHERGPARQLVGLELDWQRLTQRYLDRGSAPTLSPRVRWDALPVCANDETIGRATSVTWSPTLDKLIGFGCVATAHAAPGTRVMINWPVGYVVEPVPAVTRTLPFFKLQRTD
jgi:aminomethyltransferase